MPSMVELTQDPRLSAMLMAPHHLPRSAWLEHIPFAFWLTYEHKPRVIVELGCHAGGSYFAFCQAVRHFKISSKCFAVDHWKGDAHSGFYSEEVYRSVHEYNANLYSDFSTLIRDDFTAVSSHFDQGTIDLLHLDGLHTEDAVRNDIDHWLPKISPRGILLLHDTNVLRGDFGVHSVFSELKQKYRTFEFLHGHGLGVVGVGPHLNSEIVNLLSLPAESPEANAVRSTFATIGRGCLNSYLTLLRQKSQ